MACRSDSPSKTWSHKFLLIQALCCVLRGGGGLEAGGWGVVGFLLFFLFVKDDLWTNHS